MVEIIASGSGYSLEVGKNCEKLTQYTSNIVFKNILLENKGTFVWKIVYNNSKFGKACLAGTQQGIEFNTVIYAENKNFDFRWEIYEDEETGNFFICGNHTKQFEDNKKSVALFEIMAIDSES